jgi:hypothetical protein
MKMRLSLAAIAVALTASCGGGGGGSPPVAPAPAAGPVVDVITPETTLDVSRGATAVVSYACGDDDGEALTTLVADLDGDLATTGDQVLVATDLPETGGAPVDVAWDTTGAPLGTYTIFAVADDGDHPTATAASEAEIDLKNTAYAQGARQRAYGIAALGDGSSLVAGLFVGTTTLGAGTSAPFTLTAPGGAQEQRVFLARLRPDGGVIWARHDGAPRVNAVSASAAGASTTVGHVRFSATFGAGEPDETTLLAGVYDGYVASYRADGTFVWVRTIRPTTTADSAWPSSVARLPDGACLVAGTFHGQVTFGAGELNETVLQTLGTAPATSPDADYDLFLARYEADGRLAWARRAGGAVNDYVTALVALEDGGAALTGLFRKTATFSPGEPGEIVLTSHYADLFLARYDAAGHVVWVSRAEQEALPDGTYDPLATDYAYGQSLAVEPDGSLLVAGQVIGTVVFGEDEPTETVFTSTDPDYGDSFVARYAPDGTFIWVRRAVAGGHYAGRYLALTADGGYVLAGSLVGDAVIGPGPDEVLSDSPGAYASTDVFLARYAADGSVAWARRVGADGADDATALAAFPDGSFGLVGTITGNVVFGEGEDRQTTLSGPMFIARWNADGGF